MNYNYYDNDNRQHGLGLGGGLWCDIKETVRVKAGYCRLLFLSAVDYCLRV